MWGHPTAPWKPYGSFKANGEPTVQVTEAHARKQVTEGVLQLLYNVLIDLQ